MFTVGLFNWRRLTGRAAQIRHGIYAEAVGVFADTGCHFVGCTETGVTVATAPAEPGRYTAALPPGRAAVPGEGVGGLFDEVLYERWAQARVKGAPANCTFFLMEGVLAQAGVLLGACVFYLRQSGRPVKERLDNVRALARAMAAARAAYPTAIWIMVGDGMGGRTPCGLLGEWTAATQGDGWLGAG